MLINSNNIKYFTNSGDNVVHCLGLDFTISVENAGKQVNKFAADQNGNFAVDAAVGSQLLQTVFIGAVNLVFTILAMALVDKLGRKSLMLIGAGGLCLLYILIVHALQSGSNMLSGLLLAAIGTYAMTLAPVIWVLISEIFPVGVRSAAITIAVVSLWLAYFILVFTFPPLFERLKEYTFYIYACICAAGFLFALLRIKGPRGKTWKRWSKSSQCTDYKKNK